MGGLDAIVLAGTLVPHSEQKPSSGGTPCPHFGQARGRATPHFPQNLLPSTTSTPHPGHCKGPTLLLAFLVQYRRISNRNGRFCPLSCRLPRYVLVQTVPKQE